MRYSVAFLVAASLNLVGSAHAEQPGRNPFVPGAAASAPKDVAKREASTSASLPRLPSTSPGTYRSPAPFIPPPPAGLQLPTLQLPPPDGATGAPAALPGPKDAQTAPAKEERKSDVFMSREQLQAQRAKCSVTLKSSSDLQVPVGGGRTVVKLTLVGGRQCVKGVAASEAWVDVSSVTESGELVLMVQENEGPDERETEVNIANTGTSITIRLRQAASKEEFRQLKL